MGGNYQRQGCGLEEKQQCQKHRTTEDAVKAEPIPVTHAEVLHGKGGKERGHYGREVITFA